MIETKPFLTIDEQIKLLNTRGLITDENTKLILLRYGYFSIINGYKRPFLVDPSSEKFIEGTTFNDIYSLYKFDSELKNTTLPYLLLVESELRTAISYVFELHHHETNSYLNFENYCSEDEYFSRFENTQNYKYETDKLHRKLLNLYHSNKADYIVHYRKKYNEVPLWVLSNGLTFGNLHHFYLLLNTPEMEEVCKTISLATGKETRVIAGYLKISDVDNYIKALVDIRNICAHNDRLYCALLSGRKAVSYADSLYMLQKLLPFSDFSSLVNQLNNLLENDYDFLHLPYSDFLLKSGIDKIKNAVINLKQQIDEKAQK